MDDKKLRQLQMPNSFEKISKMSPDQSELHVAGSDRKLRKVRRPKYPLSIRRIG